MSSRIEKYVEQFIDADKDPNRPVPLPGEFHTITLGGKRWAVDFLCPCGCGVSIYLPLQPENPEGWRYRTGGNLVHPSVLQRGGCKSHFFIKLDGSVQWC